MLTRLIVKFETVEPLGGSWYRVPMCSNYRAPTDLTRIRLHFGVVMDAVSHAPEVWPQYTGVAIRRADAVEHQREGFTGQFGLLPHWAKDPTLSRRTYNARTETVAEKPSFRDAWRKGQRCIIPADWIYEPCYDTGKAVRWKIARADGAPMGLAGLWSRWWAANGAEVMTFTMLTIAAQGHPLMQRFHKPDDEKRMVVVLDEADHDRWLDSPLDVASTLLAPFPTGQLVAEAAPLPPRSRA